MNTLLAALLALIPAAPDPHPDSPPRLTCYVGVSETAPDAAGCPAETTDVTWFDQGRELRRFLTTGAVTDVTAEPGNIACYPKLAACAPDAAGWVYPDDAANYVWETVWRGEHLVYRHPIGTLLLP